MRDLEILISDQDKNQMPSSPEDELINKIAADPFGVILAWFGEHCRANKYIAMLVFLVVLSGGTAYALAARILGPSGGGKSFLVSMVLKLFPDADIWTASRVTRASLFAIKTMKALVLDEFTADADVRAVIRDIISTGRSVQYVATPMGELRELVVSGPVSFVDLQLDGTQADFQDANRVVAVNIDDSDAQIRFHAERAASAQTTDGIQLAADAELFAEACRKYVAGLALTAKSSVMLEQAPRLVPTTGALPVQFPRRLSLVRNLASIIALLRTRQPGPTELIVGADTDVARALDLLNNAAVNEDRESNTGSEIHFFRIVYLVLSNVEKATLSDIVSKLNDEKFYDKHFATTAGAKPLYPRNRVWTRRMVEKPLKELLASGLVTRTDDRAPYFWAVTTAGVEYWRHGPRTTFQGMTDAWKAATPISRGLTDAPEIDLIGGHPQAAVNKEVTPANP